MVGRSRNACIKKKKSPTFLPEDRTGINERKGILGTGKAYAKVL